METIQSRFEKFHRDNPKIYELILYFTRELKKKGRTRYGIGSVIERVRWHVSIETTGDDFKICNDYRSRYARKLMDENPEFAGFYKTRELQRL